MTNLEKYVTTFTTTFLVDPSVLPNLRYQDIDSWDSVGHMALMTALEETFAIEMDIDDIIEFSSFEYGRTILAKYNINME